MPEHGMRSAPGASLIADGRWRASFTAPGGQSVYFHWFDALDEEDAARIATDYAERSLLAEWTMNVWCPDASRDAIRAGSVGVPIPYREGFVIEQNANESYAKALDRCDDALSYVASVEEQLRTAMGELPLFADNMRGFLSKTLDALGVVETRLHTASNNIRRAR